jgi:flagellar biosynthetic protein FliR
MTALDFGFGALEHEFWRWIFVMTRIGAALLAAPFFGAAGVPPQARVVLAGALGVLVCNWTAVAAPAVLFSMSGLLAVVLQIAFAAPLIAAEVIGGGMGMNLAATVDPQTGAHSPALGQYFMVVLTLVFLGLGGHLHWLGLVVRSYQMLPPAQTWLGVGVLGRITALGSDMFLTGATMALPVTLVLLVVQLAAGVLSRAAPALNLFSLGLPAGIVAGIMALILSAPLLADRMTALSAEALGAAAQVVTR